MSYKDELSWSVSRHDMFEECLRKYYLNYYLAKNGWSEDATAEERTAYRLKNMTSYPLLAGDIVHDCIAEALKKKEDEAYVMTTEDLLAIAAKKWEKALADSASRRWFQNPKYITCIYEDWHLDPSECAPIRERHWRLIEICLLNFRDTEDWEQVFGSPVKSWLGYDRQDFVKTYVDFEHGGGHPAYSVPLYARPDFACGGRRDGRSYGKCYVFDWKTGRMRENDTYQIRFYALFAALHWGYEIPNIEARLVYIGEEKGTELLRFTNEQINEASISMRDSYGLMWNMLHNPERNLPLPMEAYPQTDDRSKCRYCNFHAMCHAK